MSEQTTYLNSKKNMNTIEREVNRSFFGDYEEVCLPTLITDFWWMEQKAGKTLSCPH